MVFKKPVIPPKSAADKRPENKPYYIPDSCPDCGSKLVLFDSLKLKKRKPWHDEWICPKCQDGVFMDWPEGSLQNLKNTEKD